MVFSDDEAELHSFLKKMGFRKIFGKLLGNCQTVVTILYTINCNKFKTDEIST